MKNFKQLCTYFLLVISSCIYTSCNSQSDYPTPEGYDLNHPVVVKLESDLNEISGIIYYPKDTGIFAISDATGSLYKIFPDRNTQVDKWKFGKNQDYEDLQLADRIFYILSSKGDIVSVKFISKDSLQTMNFDFPEKGKNEFESLYYDSSSNKLILICKDCKADKKSTVSTWSFDIATQIYSNGPFTINADNIAKDMQHKDVKFKPSAAAINPLTQELYIVSSVNKALVIADKMGAVKNVYPLNASIYKQPEGIAFTPSGDLLISNESADDGNANILILKYKKKAK